MRKFSSNTASILSIIAAVSAACTFVMTISLPYRIHQGVYAWYLWTERLLPFTSLIALVAMLCAFVIGIGSRQRLPTVLAAISCALLVFSVTHGGVHSGSNPQAWCYNNQRKIEAAKFQLASDNHLTNGAAATGAQISKYIEGGFDGLECAENGKYAVRAIGTESRCSVHGSISEMEREWQKDMHK